MSSAVFKCFRLLARFRPVVFFSSLFVAVLLAISLIRAEDIDINMDSVSSSKNRFLSERNIGSFAGLLSRAIICLNNGKMPLETAEEHSVFFNKTLLRFSDLEPQRYRVLIFMGLLEAYKQNPQGMEHYLEQAKNLLLAKRDTTGLLYLFGKKADYFYHQRDLRMQISTFLEAEKYGLRNFADFLYKKLYNELGLAYRELGIFDSARYYFQKALGFAKKMQDSAWIGILSGNLGTIYYHLGYTDSALILLKKDVQYSLANREYRSAVNALCDISEIYLDLSKYQLAKMYLDSSYSLSQRHNISLKTKINICKLYMRFYRFNQDKIALADIQKQYINLLEQLEKSEKEFSNNSKKLISDYYLAKNQLETLKSRSRVEHIVSVSLIIIVILLVMLIGFVYWNYRRHSANSKIISAQAQELKSMNTQKDKILSIISHDLRAPIANFRGMLELLSNRFITQREFQDYTKKIETNLNSLQTMMENLLHWAGSNMPLGKPKPEEIDLYEFCQMKYYFFEPLAKDKGITLSYQATAGLKTTADPNHLELIVRNLLANAIKYTKPGGHIELCCSEIGSEVMIEVRDNGVGIPEEKLAKLFSAQTHFSTPGTQGEKGTGLGLLLVKELVEKNGGRITVESTLGKQTSFKVFFKKSLSAN